MAQTRAQKVEYHKSASRIAGGNVHKAYYKHGVIYGDYFDLRIYKDVKTTFTPTDRDYSKRREGSKRHDSISRARVLLYRLVAANIGRHGRFKPIFATYTFQENVDRRSYALMRFKVYLQRLRAHLGYSPKYVAVLENQTRGALHFHVVFFNLPKLSFKLNDKMWGEGDTAVNLQFVSRIRDVSAYLSKYLSKEILHTSGINKKSFFSSRSLIRPQDVFNTDTIDTILQTGTLKLLSTYEGPTYTQIKYKL